MFTEEKDLLLKDICGRLPYGVRVWYKYETWISKKFATSIRLADEKIALSSKFNKEGDWFSVEEAGEILIKPYLRPLSSMTEEEYNELKEYSGLIYNHQLHLASFQNGAYKCLDFYLNEAPSCAVIRVFDWLNRKMFDYRGLIEKGLALETPEGMYEHESKSDVNESGSRIYVGCKIRSKTNPNEILSIISDDCHGDEFECANGDVLSLKQIEKYYDIIT